MVRPQDTLYGIARRHNVDLRDLARWNNLGPDSRVVVGQVLLLQPGSSVTPHQPPLAPTIARPQHVPQAGNPLEPPADVPAAGKAGAAAAAGRAGAAGAGTAGRAAAAQWLWPTEQSAPPRPVPGGGILLFGHLGQEVRAAGSGRVVYTGSGIRGYGNLIIVKHGGNLLSSYAHNSDMIVHEGQDVSIGQIIAHMGTAAHQVAALYFEIRLNGKPVDPLKYLPAAKVAAAK